MGSTLSSDFKTFNAAEETSSEVSSLTIEDNDKYHAYFCETLQMVPAVVHSLSTILI